MSQSYPNRAAVMSNMQFLASGMLMASIGSMPLALLIMTGVQPLTSPACKDKGIYAVSVFSVESIYYHPDIQRRIVERHAAVTGEDAPSRLENAKIAALSAIRQHSQRLSERAVEKEIREEMFRHLPRRAEIAAATPINVSIDVANVVSAERRRLQNAADAGDLSVIIAQYPVRETSALSQIAMRLGFQNREQYEGAVRKLLIDDEGTLVFVRTFFGTLAADIDAA